jgi:TonB family protein
MHRTAMALCVSTFLLAASSVAAQVGVPGDQNSPAQAMDADNPPEGFVAPRLDQPRPFTMNDYPADAFFDAVEGLSALRVLVREDGAIGDIQVVTSSGAAILNNKAIELTKLRHYTPATVNGQPVAAWIRVNYDFKVPVSNPTITPSSTSIAFVRGRMVRTTDYPPESVMRREEGTVRLRFRVANDGRLTNPEILESSGYPQLDQAAIAILSIGVRFFPGTSARRQTRYREDVTFKLQ